MGLLDNQTQRRYYADEHRHGNYQFTSLDDVINYFKNTSGLSNLIKTAPSTKNVDAMSNQGKRYAIKSTSGSSTGKFDSIPDDDNNSVFDHLVILIWNENYEPQNIYELTWIQSLKYRRWKKPENKWYVPIPIKIREELTKIL